MVLFRNHLKDRTPAAREANETWQDLLEKANALKTTRTSTDDDSSVNKPSGAWHHPVQEKKSLAHVRDNLYHLIDNPDRAASDKPGIFGVAKQFPEVTRDGYRSYVAGVLKRKAEERAEDGIDHKKHKNKYTHTLKHIFNRKDYGLIYRVRAVFHAEFAEFLGVFTLLAIGLSASVQRLLGGATYSTYTTTVLSWGFANMAGIYVVGGYSGAHLNPVVTLNLWIYRGFPFARVFSFLFAQLLGAVAAALWVFILYYPALSKLDPDGWSLETSSAFIVRKQEGIPVSTAWFNEVTCTAILHIVIFAVGDSHNIAPARGMNALVLGFTVTAIGSSFGYLTSFGMNPVRDFGPRCALSMVGFPKKMWTEDRWFWLTSEIMGPVVGGMIGALAYDVFVFDGPESPVNFPRSIRLRAISVWFYKLLHPFKDESVVDPGLSHALQKEEALEEKLDGDGQSIDNDLGKVQTPGQPAQ